LELTFLVPKAQPEIDVIDFKNISAGKFGEKICVFESKYGTYIPLVNEKIEHNIGVHEKDDFFDTDWEKSQINVIIHNIDPPCYDVGF
jgi:hypothetical protein